MVISVRTVVLWAAACGVATLAACNFGPSEQRLGCLNGCAREKDQCMLDALSSQGIQACDERAHSCTEPCPQ